MLWFIGFVLLGLVLFNFFNSVQKQESQMTAQGGIRRKYSVLIDKILSTLMDGQIFSERSDSLGIGTSHPAKGTYQYLLTQTFGKLTVQYKMDNSMFGKLNVEWVFDENTDQNTMYNKISEDVKVKTLNQKPRNINATDYRKNFNLYTVSEPVSKSEEIAKKIWNDMLKDLPEYSPLREAILNLYIPYNISPQQLAINSELFEKRDSPYDLMRSSVYKDISPSLKYFVDSPWEITRGYPDWFYIGFPDVAYWIIKGDGFNQSFSMFEHLTEDEFVENGKIKWIHLKKLVDLYLSRSSTILECCVIYL